MYWGLSTEYTKQYKFNFERRLKRCRKEILKTEIKGQ